MLGLRVSHVVKEPVFAPGQVTDLLHVFVNNTRHFEIIRVGGFAILEIDIGILGGSPQFGSFRVGSPGTKFGDRIPVCQFGHIFVIDHGNFLDFMRGAESVKKVDERNGRFDG